jgi:hypothetical protein
VAETPYGPARARDRYLALAREADIGVILALNPPGYGADFLSPVPAGVSITIGDLLEQVRSTPADQAHREVTNALRWQPPVDPRIRRILTADRVAAYVADVLAAAWQALLEPEWHTLRARGAGQPPSWSPRWASRSAASATT